MPVFKVWNVQRTQKKCVIASDLDDLLKKGKLKLGLKSEKLTVVLESDGTVVDEDDILAEFPGDTLILLEEGEEWTPCRDEGNDTISISTSNSELSEPDQPSPSVSRCDETSSPSVMPNKNDDTTSTKRPVFKDFELPTFSSLVQSHLASGTPHAVWSKLISETAHFFMDFSSYQLDSSNDYQLLGKKMYSTYPSIQMEGNQPWSLFTSNVSQRIRHIRWQRNRKTSPSGTSAPSTSNVTLPKRRCASATSPHLPENEYTMHIAEIQKEWQKPCARRSEPHLKGLMKETFSNRQAWIKGLPDASIRPIMEKFPCLEEATYLLYDFRLLLGVEPFTRLKKSMLTFKSAVEALMGAVGKSSDKMLNIITYIETCTAFERGKGKKTSPIIVVREDIADADVEGTLSTPANTAPHIVALKNDGQIKGVYVVADSITIDCQSNNLSVAILSLLAVYYVFDLDYPRIYSQILGILQTHLIKTIPYEGQKSKKYCLFSKQLKAKIEEVEKATEHVEVSE